MNENEFHHNTESYDNENNKVNYGYENEHKVYKHEEYSVENVHERNQNYGDKYERYED